MLHLLLHFVWHIDQTKPVEHSEYVSYTSDIPQSLWPIYYFLFPISQCQQHRAPCAKF